MIYSKISGTGRCLPDNLVTNADLEKMVDTSDEWIRSRTGIERRHIAAEGETTSDLCVGAAREAIEAAGVRPEDIDFIAVGTTTPDQVFPNVGCLVQEKLGIRGCPAFSLETACSGFIYALGIADKFVRTGSAQCALVIGAETLSRMVDWSDRTTCVLFGDAAAATVVEASDEPGGLLAFELGSDGAGAEHLYVPDGDRVCWWRD